MAVKVTRKRTGGITHRSRSTGRRRPRSPVARCRSEAGLKGRHHILCRAHTDMCTMQPHVGSPSFLLSPRLSQHRVHTQARERRESRQARLSVAVCCQTWHHAYLVAQRGLSPTSSVRRADVDAAASHLYACFFFADTHGTRVDSLTHCFTNGVVSNHGRTMIHVHVPLGLCGWMWFPVWSAVFPSTS